MYSLEKAIYLASTNDITAVTASDPGVRNHLPYLCTGVRNSLPHFALKAKVPENLTALPSHPLHCFHTCATQAWTPERIAALGLAISNTLKV